MAPPLAGGLSGSTLGQLESRDCRLSTSQVPRPGLVAFMKGRASAPAAAAGGPTTPAWPRLPCGPAARARWWQPGLTRLQVPRAVIAGPGPSLYTGNIGGPRPRQGAAPVSLQCLAPSKCQCRGDRAGGGAVAPRRPRAGPAVAALGQSHWHCRWPQAPASLFNLNYRAASG